MMLIIVQNQTSMCTLQQYENKNVLTRNVPALYADLFGLGHISNQVVCLMGFQALRVILNATWGMIPGLH